jgi:predicted CXXCH cytochrome family protein
MTKRQGAALCTACHSIEKQGLQAKHQGFALTRANCVDCHDPHVATAGRPGMLKPVLHMPFTQRKCAECHGERKTGATTQPVPDLCFRCHQGQKAWLSAPVVHAPLQSRESCLACHGAHAGMATGVLKRAGEKLCFQCHDPRPFRLKNVHAALEQGCSTCHDSHSGKHKRLLTEEVDTLCRQCHADMAKHFHKVSGGVDPRTNEPLDCVGCHLPHSSDQPSLLTHEPTRELCIQCHDPSMGPKRD